MEIDISPVTLETGRQCLYCDYTSNCFENIRWHTRYRCKFNNKKIICPACKLEFSTKNNLNNHIVIEHDESFFKFVTSNFYQCDLCHYRSIHKNYVLRHITKRIPQTAFECYVCHEPFDTKPTLVRHFKAHDVPSDYIYKCSRCSRPYLSKSIFDEHIVTDHKCQLSDLKYVTTICSYV